jgi:O-antigen ligase
MTRWLPAGLLLFILAAFALPTEAAFSLVFYVCVMPLAVLTAPRAIRHAHELSLAARAGLALALALILWSGLTLIWGEGDVQRTLHYVLATTATACFVLACWQVLARSDAHRSLATLLVCGGSANAAFVLVCNAPALLNNHRILGWGVTRQPILGGSVMALACLSAMALSSPQWPPRSPGRPSWMARLRAASFAAAVLMAAFVIEMQSRGVLVGFTGGTLLLGWSLWRWRSLLRVPIFYIALAPSALHDRADTMLLARGTSHRPDIWAAALQQIRLRPFFGHGLAANLPIGPTGFPHSLYLSLMFYSGAVGLLLFAALAAVVTLRLIRAPPGPRRSWVAALWVNALLAGLTDFGQITKGPGPLWFILWVPIALALTLPVTPRAAVVALPRAAN